MPLRKRFLILPLTDAVIHNYKGFVVDGELRPDLNESNVYITYRTLLSCRKPHPFLDLFRRLIQSVLIIALFPARLIERAIWYNSYDGGYVQSFVLFVSYCLILKPHYLRIITHRHKYKVQGNCIVEEDIPRLLAKATENRYKIILYGFDPDDENVKVKIDNLVEQYNVYRVFPSENVELENFVIEEANPRNSTVVVTDYSKVEWWRSIGFFPRFNPNGIYYVDYQVVKKSSKSDIQEISCYAELAGRGIPYYMYASGAADVPGEIVYYVGTQDDEYIRSFILTHYNNISARFEKEGFLLRFLPVDFMNDSVACLDRLYDQIVYLQPSIRNYDSVLIKNSICTVLQNSSHLELEQAYLAWLDLPLLDGPAFVRMYPKYSLSKEKQFTYYLLKAGETSLDEQLDFYFEQLRKSLKGNQIYFSVKDDETYDADNFFYSFNEQSDPDEKELDEAGEDRELLLSIHNRLELMKTEQQMELLTGLLKELSNKLRAINPDFAIELMSVVNRHTAKVKLSRLLVTADYRILLPDYNNLEIPMYPLARIVFLLFLRHPEGILFKHMSDHRRELEDLYIRVTGRAATEKIRQSLNDLVDPTNSSINQKVARIRSAFRAFLPEEIADHYTITGSKAEPKRILIDRGLVISE